MIIIFILVNDKKVEHHIKKIKFIMLRF